MAQVKFEVINVPMPKGVNVIVGTSHFIKTVEDLYETLITSSPNIRFGLAFSEASGDRLVRYDGNDKDLIKLAVDTALKVGAGHFFIIYMREAWPINVLNALKNVQEVVNILAATANPLQIIVAETDQGRGVVGVIDGFKPLGVEGEDKIRERKEFLRKIGYKR